jgi:hypothetical protein
MKTPGDPPAAVTLVSLSPLALLGEGADRLAVPNGERHERRVAVVVNAVRMAFGALAAFRALDMAGFSILAAQPSSYAAGRFVEAVAALGVAFGLFTPASFLVLLGSLCTDDAGQYLGLQVARMLTVGLLLAGAGRRFSLDALALRVPDASRFLRPLYALAPSEPAALGPVRLLLLGMYWAVTLAGVRYHFFDSFWLRGEVLQLALTMPYFSDHHALFVAARDRSPEVFDLLCRAGLYVQAFWQLALLPLALFLARPLRLFVVVQGLAFFAVSTFVLNLGALGPFELLLWALVFGVAPGFGLDPGLRSSSRPREHGLRFGVLAVGAAAVSLFMVQNLAAIADAMWHTRMAAALPAPRALLLPFGLRRVNVFNQADIRMGTAHLVLAEEDAQGGVVRVVPFLDKDGGRLDYLRNDLLYFGWSLRWQRMSRGQQVTSTAPPALTAHTRRLLRQVGRLDACLEGAAGPRAYRAFLLTRDIGRRGQLPVWTDTSPIASWGFRVEADPARTLVGAAAVLGCYDLPPGHARSGVRTRETLRWVRAISR